LLQFLALLFLVPGIFGLIVSAILSTNYAATLPRVPDPASMRIVPRDIHGITVFQTADEDRTLTDVEYGALALFLVGVTLSVVYIERRYTVSHSPLEHDAHASA
jgi:hypothetical protein